GLLGRVELVGPFDKNATVRHRDAEHILLESHSGLPALLVKRFLHPIPLVDYLPPRALKLHHLCRHGTSWGNKNPAAALSRRRPVTCGAAWQDWYLGLPCQVLVVTSPSLPGGLVCSGSRRR